MDDRGEENIVEVVKAHQARLDAEQQDSLQKLKEEVAEEIRDQHAKQRASVRAKYQAELAAGRETAWVDGVPIDVEKVLAPVEDKPPAGLDYWVGGSPNPQPNYEGVKESMNDQGEYVTKDSGERASFASGMVRDTTTGKTLWHKVADGPLLKRWAELLSRGAEKYPDDEIGQANWMLADGIVERERFRQSAFRHFMQWYNGDTDEDHAAAVFFNINGCEYVKDRIQREPSKASDVDDDSSPG